MTTTRVYVDRGVIESNTRTGDYRPPVIAEQRGIQVVGYVVSWSGYPARVVYDPTHTPAHVFVEVDGPVVVDAQLPAGPLGPRECVRCGGRYEGHAWTPCPNNNCPAHSGAGQSIPKGGSA